MFDKNNQMEERKIGKEININNLHTPHEGMGTKYNQVMQISKKSRNNNNIQITKEKTGAHAPFVKICSHSIISSRIQHYTRSQYEL